MTDELYNIFHIDTANVIAHVSFAKKLYPNEGDKEDTLYAQIGNQNLFLPPVKQFYNKIIVNLLPRSIRLSRIFLFSSDSLKELFAMKEVQSELN